MNDWQEKTDDDSSGYVEKLKLQTSNHANDRPDLPASKAVPINQKLRDEKKRLQRLSTDIADKDQRLREITIKRLFMLLWIELALLVGLVLLKGFGVLWRWRFRLDSLSFRVIIAAVFGQMTIMLVLVCYAIFSRPNAP